MCGAAIGRVATRLLCQRFRIVPQPTLHASRQHKQAAITSEPPAQAHAALSDSTVLPPRLDKPAAGQQRGELEALDHKHPRLENRPIALTQLQDLAD